MKKLIAALAAASAVGMAMPLAAQTGVNRDVYAGSSANIANRIARLDARIQMGVNVGTISPTEARNLRLELRQITRVERRYSRGGYTQAERRDLQQRLRGFRDQLAAADGRGNQYGYRNDGYYGQGGPYEEVECHVDQGSFGGIGGIFDSIFGGDEDDCVGLRVGQQASGNLSVLPAQYRSQFRDGNGIVYRTDGTQIYQIDVRTNTVLRVYGMTR
jgi:hypothetical protein